MSLVLTVLGTMFVICLCYALVYGTGGIGMHRATAGDLGFLLYFMSVALCMSSGSLWLLLAVIYWWPFKWAS